VKSALLANDFVFPPKRITINLAPSDIKKEGSQFDLSFALLIALDSLQEDISEWFAFGELGLDGAVKENNTLFPLILSLVKQKLLYKAIVPKESVEKLSKIPNLELYGVDTLQEAIDFMQKKIDVEPCKSGKDLEFSYLEIDAQKLYYTKEYEEDFYEVKGQKIAKRAALISAAGFHNILLEGSPGCGKSMIAKRLQHILPPMNLDDILEKSKLDSLEGKEPNFKPQRSFRAPHHTATAASIFGGGSHKAQIGEVGLANKGILFFDELPYFSKNVLEALREPMQDQKIRVSRVNSKVEYDADFLFIGAMNPCPCGNLLHHSKECRCSELEIKRYKNRLSDPFLDRIDLTVTMQNSNIKDTKSVQSIDMHKTVSMASIFRVQRGQKKFNAKLSDQEVEKYCVLNEEAEAILAKAIENFSLSFRSYTKIKKVARTIADIEKSEHIDKTHILEALSFRRRDV
jgi:magnesium chelatase family protein